MAHTNSRLRAQTLRRFVSAYQDVQPLEIGELWAFAISLRVVLIENLRRAAVQIVDQSTAAADQAACNVTVRNVITALRSLSDINWPEFVESVSLVDQRLREVSDFQAMDFATRNLYRAEIEELSRQSKSTELQVTAELIRRLSLCPKDRVRERDPGFYLLSEGRPGLEHALGYRPARARRIRRAIRAGGAAGYITATLVLSAIVLLIPLVFLWAHAVGPLWLLILGVVGAVPASDVAVSILNRVLTGCLTAQVLPALALRDGVPASMRTLVVVPTLLTSREASSSSSNGSKSTMSPRRRANCISHCSPIGWMRMPNRCPATTSYWQQVTAGIARLNRLYGASGQAARFYVFHRRRVWSEDQARWMGWERKRGKLHELNRLLRGATDTTFIAIGGRAPPVPTDVRYVITLDADTRLPRDAAERLIGKMAHPLNRPRFRRRRATRWSTGYAILQPRVTPSLPVGQEGSLFQRVFSGPAGWTRMPRPSRTSTRTSSAKVVHRQGHLRRRCIRGGTCRAGAGKRLAQSRSVRRDVRARRTGVGYRSGRGFPVALRRRAASGSIAGRAATGSCCRGYWATGARRRDAALGRWKMLDNLRRSLLRPCAVLALALGWLLPLRAARLWTAFVLVGARVPAFLPALPRSCHDTPASTLRNHLGTLGADLRLPDSQTCFGSYSWLTRPGCMGDAIVRTLRGFLIPPRSLLEWTTAAQSQGSSTPRLERLLPPHGGRHWLLGLHRCWRDRGCARGTGRSSLPFALLWLACSGAGVGSADRRRRAAIARSRPGRARPAPDRAAHVAVLRDLRHAADNMLPPDNFQEDPKPVVAHRTSPTNIGLYFLSASPRARFRLGSARRRPSSGSKRRSLRCGSSRVSRAFLQLVRHLDLRALEPRVRLLGG